MRKPCVGAGPRRASAHRLRTGRPAAVADPARTALAPGTTGAGSPVMAAKVNESWTIPLHITVWTALSVGFIMVLVVILMH